MQRGRTLNWSDAWLPIYFILAVTHAQDWKVDEGILIATAVPFMSITEYERVRKVTRTYSTLSAASLGQWRFK